MRAPYNKLAFEEKLARKYYCNNYRLIWKMKRYNYKKFRMNKKVIATVDEPNSMA